jgi:hypothetical protein
MAQKNATEPGLFAWDSVLGLAALKIAAGANLAVRTGKVLRLSRRQIVPC